MCGLLCFLKGIPNSKAAQVGGPERQALLVLGVCSQLSLQLSQIGAPSITSSSKTLYMRKPVALEKATRGNLDKPLKELMASGEELVVTDPVFPDTSLGLVVTFV